MKEIKAQGAGLSLGSTRHSLPFPVPGCSPHPNLANLSHGPHPQFLARQVSGGRPCPVQASVSSSAGGPGCPAVRTQPPPLRLHPGRPDPAYFRAVCPARASASCAGAGHLHGSVPSSRPCGFLREHTLRPLCSPVWPAPSRWAPLLLLPGAPFLVPWRWRGPTVGTGTRHTAFPSSTVPGPLTAHGRQGALQAPRETLLLPASPSVAATSPWGTHAGSCWPPLSPCTTVQVASSYGPCCNARLCPPQNCLHVRTQLGGGSVPRNGASCC